MLLNWGVFQPLFGHALFLTFYLRTVSSSTQQKQILGENCLGRELGETAAFQYESKLVTCFSSGFLEILAPTLQQVLGVFNQSVDVPEPSQPAQQHIILVIFHIHYLMWNIDTASFSQVGNLMIIFFGTFLILLSN